MYHDLLGVHNAGHGDIYGITVAAATLVGACVLLIPLGFLVIRTLTRSNLRR